MSNALAEYLSALEARDAREQAHAEYINAYTKLADRTAVQYIQAPAPVEPSAPSPNQSSRTIRPGTPRGKASPAPPDTSSPSNLAQMRAELASTQRTRSELETKLSAQATELSGLKTTDAEQKKRIAQLERIKEQLERRTKDRAEELKGKGKFVEDLHDEMVALNLQLNLAEQEKDKLKKENEELTKRWVEKMEQEAKSMNEINERGWRDGSERKK